MSSNRQLAAIMFTDIVGYTALMGEDEQKAFELLRKNRQIQRPLIERYTGKWIKELGDGVLASFSTAIDAVLCAVSIQDNCNDIPGLKLRIGIHLGDVIFEEGDIFGDGVNIASRLQAMAPVGGIWVSEAIYRTISNKKEIETKFVCSEALKNVKELVQIYEVIINNKPRNPAAITKASTKNNVEKSIAVLPFANMSNDPEQEYFSDGIAEEILNSLAQVHDLKVAARTSAFQFKGKNIDLREVGQKLNVATVLEGSVRKQGNRLRITAQLINVTDGYHLWSERYDREMDDVFAIQDEIAIAITEKLKITLLENEKAVFTKSTTENTVAYELYLKGRFYLNRRGRFIITASECFQQAIDLDPHFAPAYAGYADACLLSAYYSFYPAKTVMPKAKQAADMAIRIDKTLCEPYTSLGFYYGFYEWNFLESKKNFQKAIELNPYYVTGHFWYGMLYLSWIEANFEQAKNEGQIAIRLDPLSAIAHALQSTNYFVAREYDEAERIGKIAIELDASSYIAFQATGWALVGLKKYTEAIEIFQHAMQMSNRYQWAVFNLAWAYSQYGNFSQMKELINELDQRAASEYISPFHRCLAAAWAGDLDLAITYLEKAYDDCDPILITLNTWPNVPDTLRNDIRCQEVIKRMGFPK